MVLDSSVEVDTRRLSIRQVRELLDSISTPQPELLAVLCSDRRVTVRRLAYRLLRQGGDMASNEEIFRDGEVRFLAGTDEAGRGALAGPLAAAAVMFAPDAVIEDVRDSKALLPGKREELYDRIL
ncbi:MAG: ribonuclease HII, partial [Actinobacteria bacterium]|nr:ribonuclease HII [Actinomycetota bacterium]